jgi:hypothetical protein
LESLRFWLQCPHGYPAAECATGYAHNRSRSVSGIGGTWISPYDDLRITDPQAIDVDHMVPLKNAWISGARDWTRQRRQAFANDMEIPQLWAVSARTNRSKADKSPDRWMPPSAAIACIYVRAWTEVKYEYQLNVTQPEHDTLAIDLTSCA